MKKSVIKIFILRLLGFLFFLGLSWLLFTMPAKATPSYNIPHIDKAAHLCIFFMLTMLWLYATEIFYTSLWKKMLFSTFSVFIWIGYGFFIEWVQKEYFIGRSFEIADILADTLGVVIAQNIFILWCIIRKKGS